MKVSGTTVIHEDVEIDPFEVINQVVHAAYYKAKIPNGAELDINTGMLSVHHDTHGSGYDEDVGLATPAQRKLIELCEAFQDLARRVLK